MGKAKVKMMMMIMICTGKLHKSGLDHVTWAPKLGSPVATAAPYLKKRIDHSHIPSLIPSLDFGLQNIASTQDQSFTPVSMQTMWHTRMPPRMKWC